MTIKDRVRQLCDNKGISMHQLEREVGIARGYLSKLDKVTPSGRKLQLIADYFDVSTDYILTGKEDAERTPYYQMGESGFIAQEIYNRPELRVLFSEAINLTPEDLTFLYETLIALKKRNNDAGESKQISFLFD